MLIKKQTKLLKTFQLVLLLFLALIPVILANFTKANSQSLPSPQTQNCGSENLSYNALYQMQEDAYDIYVRMGKREQSATTTLYFQSFTGSDCQKLGTTSSNGNMWTKIGELNVKSQNSLGTFTLGSAEFQDLPNANRPTILLVSKTHPVCAPADECYVTINNQKGVLHATGTLLNEASLHVVTAKDPATDKIARVDYYVDNTPVYSKSQLEPFDLRYVSGGKHNLATVITYDSHQQIVIPKYIEKSYTDDLAYWLFIFTKQQKIPLIAFGSLVLVLLLLNILLRIARYFYKKHQWKATHIVQNNETHSEITPSTQFHYIRPESKLTKITKYTLPIAIMGALAITGIIVLNTWFFQSYQVDGASMESTLHTNEQLVVNKAGKTFSSLTGKKFIPKRGEIIVFRKERNVLFEPTEAEKPSFVVKRVIALPGERVTINAGIITVYNTANPQGLKVDENKKWSGNIHLNNLDNIDLTLGPGEIFVSGDNRPDSIDSRSYGPIKADEIVGDVVARVFPVGKFQLY